MGLGYEQLNNDYLLACVPSKCLFSEISRAVLIHTGP